MTSANNPAASASDSIQQLDVDALADEFVGARHARQG